MNEFLINNEINEINIIIIELIVDDFFLKI